MKQVSLFFLVVLSANVYAQNSSDNGHDLIRKIYRQAIGEYSQVYTGLQYTDYDFNIADHQYFLTNEPSPSDLIFDDIAYENIKLLYDVNLDEVIVVHDSTTFRTILVKDKLQRFSIYDNKFVHLTDAEKYDLPDGIYQLLYDGEMKVLVKRTKIIREYVKDGKFNREFVPKNTYFARTDNETIEISNSNSLLKIFGDKKKLVKRHLKNEKIKFRKDKENAILSSFTYFESL